jgi:hypothetical protein
VTRHGRSRVQPEVRLSTTPAFVAVVLFARGSPEAGCRLRLIAAELTAYAKNGSLVRGDRREDAQARLSVPRSEVLDYLVQAVRASRLIASFDQVL